MNTLILIVGPTGIGKTELSVKLAKLLDAEIISCDSMQVYRGMNIGTAKVTEPEKQGVSHHMIDIISPFQSFSVSDFCIQAKAEAQKIFAKGKPVIMVGGTGLYADSFVRDIDFTETGSSKEIRSELMDFCEKEGTEALFQILKSVDPESAEAIHMNNVKRVIRAIEYYRLTGETISEHNRKTKEKPSPYKYVYIGLTRNREELYERINNRVDKMMQSGLLAEVWTLYAMGCSLKHTSMQALGYKELIWYLQGKCNLSEAVEILKRDSRRYAKRQLTWFGRSTEVNWINLSEASDPVAEALSILKNNEVTL